ncbi:MAG TPA: nitrophenyl compound nitroreductase subunit ArsF family protein [Bacteroidales bacterium]|nr:nitrophenyl compound nitroreductase subunit ArsF family protein [Bacteroidales bacterium]HOU31458.1 nitrophenyl compound nitroreductase subunit ArsF family protein [Bacteroidales bacterium]
MSISSTDTGSPVSDRIEIYYFHFTMRCATCLTIEAKTKEYLEELYPDHLRAGLITFKALNIEEEVNKSVAERFGITGQALIIVKGKKKWSYLDAMLLGLLFALAFCPYSGVLYFGMLIPMTVASSSGLYLPVIFAIATGIPVIIFAWIIAYTVSGIGSVYNKLKNFEFWFRRTVAVLFIVTGIYYSIKMYL